MTILYWVRKNQTNRKGECPIWYSISMHPLKDEFSCKISIHPQHWDQAAQQASGPLASYINAPWNKSLPGYSLLKSSYRLRTGPLARNC